MKSNKKGRGMDRRFICIGLGKTYEVEALGNGQAQQEAARQYKEETGDPKPVQFLAFFFSTEAVDRKRPGRKSSIRRAREALKQVGEVMKGRRGDSL